MLIIFALACATVYAQTSAFTYQGKLTDGGTAANGTYDFKFTIYGADIGGFPVSGDIILEDVQATNGIFTVNLNFGTLPFDSPTDNHLEMAVRPGASSGAFTTLMPRQRITSSPYSIKAISAASADSLSGVLGASQGGTGIGPTFPAADTFLRSNGAGWQATGISSFDIPPGSTNYVQNGNSAQPGVNFNVGGTGTANLFDAATQYNIGGSRILSNPGNSNLFVGTQAGLSNTTGSGNNYFGTNAGASNSTGNNNNFFGLGTGTGNSGSENTFVGNVAGNLNQTGMDGTFFGASTGGSNTTGNGNAFFGRSAGFTNTTGSSNTMLGSFANVTVDNLNFASAIGSGASVSTSNSVVLGRAADTVRIPGALKVQNPNGLIVASPNAACWSITVSNAGALSAISVACP